MSAPLKPYEAYVQVLAEPTTEIPAAEILCEPPVGPPVLEPVHPALGRRALAVRQLLSPKECDALIQFFEDQGITQKYECSTQFRDMFRLAGRGAAFRAIVGERLAPLLTDCETKLHISEENEREYSEHGGIRGDWTLDGVNDHFRISKYEPGGKFAPHRDGDLVLSYDRRSVKTVLIYLNEDYTGGATNFLEEEKLARYDDGRVNTLAPTPAEAILRAFRGQQGDAVIFDHVLMHEGAPVIEGTKYIVRSELLYTRSSDGVWTEEREREKLGTELAIRAAEAEQVGKLAEACEMYRKAFKLWPPLERQF